MLKFNSYWAGWGRAVKWGKKRAILNGQKISHKVISISLKKSLDRDEVIDKLSVQSKLMSMKNNISIFFTLFIIVESFIHKKSNPNVNIKKMFNYWF